MAKATAQEVREEEFEFGGLRTVIVQAAWKGFLSGGNLPTISYVFLGSL
jgi:hypothetical protein